jgi:hypothetical protein
MSNSKEKMLQKAGWTIGDASDLLELSPAENALIEMKLSLANALFEKRKKAHFTQIQVANMLHTSQSRIAKMEVGDPSVSIELLIKGLLALGETPFSVGTRLQAVEV